jgi:hypothetical protein
MRKARNERETEIEHPTVGGKAGMERPSCLRVCHQHRLATVLATRRRTLVLSLFVWVNFSTFLEGLRFFPIDMPLHVLCRWPGRLFLNIAPMSYRVWKSFS